METAPVPFDRLYAHRDWVRRVARALVLDDSRAADLEQQVWLAALENPPREARSLRGWLGTVLRNTASKMRRSEERTGRREETAPPRPGEPGPDEIVAETEAHERVVRAVLALEEPYRTTVLLRYFEDLPPGAVAGRLSVPVETVRTRLRRALEQVRARLDGENGGDRRAWALMLLPLARRARGEPAAAGIAGAATAAGIGGLVMGTTAKTAAAAVVLGIAGVALWMRPWAPEEPLPGAASRAVADAEPGGGAAVGPAVAAAIPPVAAPAGEDSSSRAAVEVVDARGAPVPGAVVLLLPRAPNRVDPSGGWPFSLVAPAEPAPALVRVAADSSGRATLRAPEPGSWTFRVEAAGFAAASRREWLRRGREVPLRVVLRRGFPLSGTVRDAAGRPVPGAVVAADRSRYGVPSGPVASPPTGAGGDFRLEGLAAGMSDLTVRTAAGIVHTAGSVRLPGVSALDLRIGGGVSVKGRVLDDATGEPIAGAAVAVEVCQGGRTFSGMGTARTNAGGEYSVTDLPPGDSGLRITGVREGYRRSPPFEVREPAVRGVIASGSVWEKDIRLSAGTDPSPFPREETPDPQAKPGSVEGIVLDPSGAAAAGVVVTVWTSANPYGGGPDLVTDADGRFRGDGIPAGRGSLYARPDGRGGVGASLAFTLESGQALGGLRIEMKKGGTIAGAVRRSDGAPVAGPLLWSSRGRFAGPVRDHPKHLMRDDSMTTIRPDGSFRHDGLQAGTWLLAAEAEGCAPSASPILELADGQEISGVEIVLEPLLGISGRVSDGEGGPIAAAQVSMEPSRREGRGVYAVTDSEGRFRVDGLRAGTVKVAAEAEGFRGAEMDAGAGDDAVHLVLERTLFLAGRVIEAGTGRPLGGVPVVARPENRTDGRQTPRGRWETISAPDGSFRIDGVVDGDWTVTAGVDGFRRSTDFFPKTVKGVKAGSEGLEFTVHRGARIRGRFIDGTGSPFVIPLRVQSYRRKPDGELESSGGEAEQGEDGSFELGGLEPGTYDLWVRPGQGRGDDTPPTMLVEGVATGQEPIGITVPRGVRIRGRIANLPGPLTRGKGGHIRLRGTGESWWPASSPWPNEDGTFETEPLDPSRTYEIWAQDFPGLLGALHGVSPGPGEIVLELSEGLRISGVVVDEDGASVGAGVPVLAWATGAGPERAGARATGATAADGSFTLSGLADLRYGVQAGGTGSEFLWGHAGETPLTYFAAGATGLVVRVRRGAVVEGRLLDAAGRPIAGRKIEGLSGACPGSVTDDQGAFVLRGVSPGEVKLRVDGRTLGPYPAPSTGLEVRLPDR